MEAEKEAIEKFIAIQTRGNSTLSPEEILKIILARRRKFIFMIGINVLAVLFFSFSIYNGISQLPKWILTALFITFAVNIFVIVRQLQWVSKSIRYLKK